MPLRNYFKGSKKKFNDFLSFTNFIIKVKPIIIQLKIYISLKIFLLNFQFL